MADDSDINASAILEGIFLIILVIAGNYIAETLSCQTQRVMASNMLTKHAVVLLTIYFALVLANSKHPLHPFNMLGEAIAIYVAFLLFTKMTLEFTAVAFTLLAVAYVLSTFVAYYEHEDRESGDAPQYTEAIRKCRIAMHSTLLAALVVICLLYTSPSPRDGLLSRMPSSA